MAPLVVVILFLDQLVNLYVEPITLWCTRRWRKEEALEVSMTGQTSECTGLESFSHIDYNFGQCFEHGFSFQIYFPRAWYAEVLVTSTWNRQTGLLIVVRYAVCISWKITQIGISLEPSTECCCENPKKLGYDKHEWKSKMKIDGSAHIPWLRD